MKFSFSFFLLIFMMFLTEIATDVYVPSLPTLMIYFETSLELLNFTMSLHLVGFAFGQIVCGTLSDRYGRRSVLLLGGLLFVVATLACPFSQNISTLIVLRFIQGIGASVPPIIGMAIVKDLYQEATPSIKMLSLMSMLTALSPIIGPILGASVVDYLGWQGLFYMLGLSSAFTMVLLYQNLKETHIPIVKGNTSIFNLYSLKCFFSQRTFMGLVLINALTVACVWVFITAAPFILMQLYHISLLHYGFYQAFTVVAYILGGLLINRLINHWDANFLSNLGLGFALLGGTGLFALWLLDGLGPISFIAMVSCYGFGLGILRPTLINNIMHLFPNQRGASAAMLGTFEMLISALAIATVGAFEKTLLLAVVGMFAVSPTISFILFIFFQIGVRFKQNKPTIST